MMYKIYHYASWQPPRCRYLLARHPNDLMVHMARYLRLGWPPQLTVSVVSKYFPTTFASCSLGNLQSTNVYNHFKATTIGQTELVLKVWTTVDGNRAYSFKKHLLPALILSLARSLVPHLRPEKVWFTGFTTLVILRTLSSEPTMNLTQKVMRNNDRHLQENDFTAFNSIKTSCLWL